MRVTTAMLTRQVLHSVNSRATALDRSLERISSGKRLQRPSDDPAGASTALHLRHSLRVNEGDRGRLDYALHLQETAESALSQSTDLLHRARELILAAGSDTMEVNDGAASAADLEAVRDALLGLANTRTGDRYVFAGTNTRSEPFTSGADGVTYAGNDESLTVPLGSGASVRVVPSGADAFLGSGNVFAALDDAISAARSGDREALRGDILDRVSAGLDRAAMTRSALGARMNETQARATTLADQRLLLAEQLSSAEDVDLPEEIMNSQLLQTGMQATFLAASRILPLSLVDYVA